MAAEYFFFTILTCYHIIEGILIFKVWSKERKRVNAAQFMGKMRELRDCKLSDLWFPHHGGGLYRIHAFTTDGYSGGGVPGVVLAGGRAVCLCGEQADRVSQLQYAALLPCKRSRDFCGGQGIFRRGYMGPYGGYGQVGGRQGIYIRAVL